MSYFKKISMLLFILTLNLSLKSHSACYPGVVTGNSNYPIALVDYNTVTFKSSAIFGRIDPDFSRKTAKVYTENTVTNKFDFLGEYPITNITSPVSCGYSYPYVKFKLLVPGDNGDTWVSLYKESDSRWSNRVKWQGKIYERTTFWPQTYRIVSSL